MKYYEFNGIGNQVGPSNLQCPLCGNVAVGVVRKNQQISIINGNAGLLFIDKGSGKTRIEDDIIIYCPQCSINMINHEAVKEWHERERCPGCFICGRIHVDIFNICRDCILANRGTAFDCGDCRYNYSRAAHGIDVGEMKLHFNIEMARSEYGYQMSLFEGGVHRKYSTTMTNIGRLLS